MVHVMANNYEFNVRSTITHRTDYYNPVLNHLRKGDPVPRDLLQPSIEMTFPPDNPPEMLAPFDTPPVMPDFFFWCHVLVVSRRFRAVLEAHVPECYEYIPVPIICPDIENVSDAYWYANLLSKGQLIDWEHSTIKSPKHWPDGSVTARWAPPASPEPLRMRFKSMPLYHVWHEINHESGGVLYAVESYETLVSDALWAVLDKAFPEQLPDDQRFNDY